VARFQVSDPMNWVTRTLPYIFSIRDYFNSRSRQRGVLRLPMWLILFVRIAFLALAVGSLWLLYRYYRPADPLFGWRHRRVCC